MIPFTRHKTTDRTLLFPFAPSADALHRRSARFHQPFGLAMARPLAFRVLDHSEAYLTERGRLIRNRVRAAVVNTAQSLTYFLTHIILLFFTIHTNN